MGVVDVVDGLKDTPPSEGLVLSALGLTVLLPAVEGALGVLTLVTDAADTGLGGCLFEACGLKVERFPFDLVELLGCSLNASVGVNLLLGVTISLVGKSLLDDMPFIGERGRIPSAESEGKFPVRDLGLKAAPNAEEGLEDDRIGFSAP